MADVCPINYQNVNWLEDHEDCLQMLTGRHHTYDNSESYYEGMESFCHNSPPLKGFCKRRPQFWHRMCRKHPINNCTENINAGVAKYCSQKHNGLMYCDTWLPPTTTTSTTTTTTTTTSAPTTTTSAPITPYFIGAFAGALITMLLVGMIVCLCCRKSKDEPGKGEPAEVTKKSKKTKKKGKKGKKNKKRTGTTTSGSQSRTKSGTTTSGNPSMV